MNASKLCVDLEGVIPQLHLESKEQSTKCVTKDVQQLEHFTWFASDISISAHTAGERINHREPHKVVHCTNDTASQQ
jgi:hypothetical protein